MPAILQLLLEARSREILHHHVRGLGLVRGVVGSDDVRVLRQVLAILQLLLEARSGGSVFADGLDGHFTPVGLVFCNPGSAVSAFASRLDEGVALIEASSIASLTDSAFIAEPQRAERARGSDSVS